MRTRPSSRSAPPPRGSSRPRERPPCRCRHQESRQSSDRVAPMCRSYCHRLTIKWEPSSNYRGRKLRYRRPAGVHSRAVILATAHGDTGLAVRRARRSAGCSGTDIAQRASRLDKLGSKSAESDILDKDNKDNEDNIGSRRRRLPARNWSAHGPRSSTTSTDFHPGEVPVEELTTRKVLARATL